MQGNDFPDTSETFHMLIDPDKDLPKKTELGEIINVAHSDSLLFERMRLLLVMIASFRLGRRLNEEQKTLLAGAEQRLTTYCFFLKQMHI